eukprot:Gb_30906 [translate_table: standard]
MAGDGSGAIPATVLESLQTLNDDYHHFQSNLSNVLAACDPDVLAELPPLERAHTFFILAKAVATLFTLRLRCCGESPEEHPVKSELERLDLYESKIGYYIGRTKAPRPTTTIDTQAATRFIEHSLPDLTPEQRHSMRDISRGERHGSKTREIRGGRKKRKHELADKQSVAEAAAAFLAEASKEIFTGVGLRKQEEEEELEEVLVARMLKSVGFLHSAVKVRLFIAGLIYYAFCCFDGKWKWYFPKWKPATLSLVRIWKEEQWYMV